ncbi:glycosyl transferase family 1 [Salmonella enterica subsp. enterica serovar Benin]|uniref:HVO_A0114 family putative DNA-binding protein n=1 Tax=Salmonella enterica TaxID=28901 RepID=UPI000BA0AF2D|nr:glycosyl transferase family 1 [Salmonella enterica]EBV4144310.1 glycosyl transferase family 1 [Salmonella enterica subsp. enterica serovar Benin]EBW4219517.1 glycosyl transferase family 1 [Salmonella enterica subsp. enterica serovar Benin]ECE9228690.1 glycosyl transferase family 1 [Salmonella enterica subsp. enterica serovar Benin]EIE1655539.1 glycosyl transferase family 1 [Salmonella enterica]OZU09678.1 glycosyl transferase family 1 [Salmonella enterica subsp. enterica serovar Altendorf]
MTTVTIKVASLDEVRRNTIATMQGDKSAHGEFINFLSFGDLHSTLTPKRMDILNAMTGEDELTFREVASRGGRDVKAMRTDVTALIKCGIVERGDSGVIFSYDGMHFDFLLGHGHDA